MKNSSLFIARKDSHPSCPDFGAVEPLTPVLGEGGQEAGVHLPRGSTWVSWGWAMVLIGGKEGCLPSLRPYPSFPGLWATIACLSLNYLYFHFEAARRGKEGREGHTCAAVSPRQDSQFPAWFLVVGWFSSSSASVSTGSSEPGGNRGLEKLGGGTVVRQTAAARAKFSL